MNHTSGLPGQSPFISDNSITLQQAVDNIGLNTPMSFTPGTEFRYGGVSMHVAGRMAEIATGMTWDSLFQQKIAIPLGMANTDYVALGATTNYRIAGGMGTTMPDFSKLLTMLLNYGYFNNTQVIDSLTVKMMQSDQTNGVPLSGSPYAGDPLRENFRYGYGVWVEEETNGETTQYGSQGAFGFTPWIDRCRNIACVFFVRRTLGIIQPTHTQLRNLVEQIIPIKLQQPTITLNGNQLQSSYQNGNQWYLNDTILSGETNQFINPTQSGNYSVKYTSEEGCEIFSNDFNHIVLSINEYTNQGAVSIFPNPANTIINIDCKKGFQIYSSTGQLVKQSSQPTTQVNISDLPTGLYIIKTDNQVGRFLKTE
jgi:hypothetical protein